MQNKSKWLKKYINTNPNENKAGVAILTSYRAEFKARKITRDKEDEYIMKKG